MEWIGWQYRMTTYRAFLEGMEPIGRSPELYDYKETTMPERTQKIKMKTEKNLTNDSHPFPNQKTKLPMPGNDEFENGAYPNYMNRTYSFWKKQLKEE